MENKSNIQIKKEKEGFNISNNANVITANVKLPMRILNNDIPTNEINNKPHSINSFNISSCNRITGIIQSKDEIESFKNSNITNNHNIGREVNNHVLSSNQLNQNNYFSNCNINNSNKNISDGMQIPNNNDSTNNTIHNTANLQNNQESIKSRSLRLKQKQSSEKDLKMLNNNEKNDYQKKLTNQIAIDKYKVQCLQILKDDDEVRSLADKLKLNNELGKFIDEYFFNDLSFQFKLELFLIQKNGNTKNKKAKFFRDEIMKVLEFKMLDLQFEEKMGNLLNRLDQQFKSIDKLNII